MDTNFLSGRDTVLDSPVRLLRPPTPAFAVTHLTLPPLALSAPRTPSSPTSRRRLETRRRRPVASPPLAPRVCAVPSPPSLSRRGRIRTALSLVPRPLGRSEFCVSTRVLLGALLLLYYDERQAPTVSWFTVRPHLNVGNFPTRLQPRASGRRVRLSVRSFDSESNHMQETGRHLDSCYLLLSSFFRRQCVHPHPSIHPSSLPLCGKKQPYF